MHLLGVLHSSALFLIPILFFLGNMAPCVCRGCVIHEEYVWEGGGLRAVCAGQGGCVRTLMPSKHTQYTQYNILWVVL